MVSPADVSIRFPHWLMLHIANELRRSWFRSPRQLARRIRRLTSRIEVRPARATDDPMPLCQRFAWRFRALLAGEEQTSASRAVFVVPIVHVVSIGLGEGVVDLSRR